MRRDGLMWLGLLVCAASGCSDDGVVSADADSTPSNTSGAETGDLTAASSDSADPTLDPSGGTTDDGASDTDGPDADSSGEGTSGAPDPGALPEPPVQSGVAYVAHFLANELRWFRTDGDAPTAGGTFDLGAATHDMALDPVHDRLVFAHDVARRVALYGITRPDAADTPVEAPTLLGQLDLDTAPRFVRVDPYHERLYIVADDTRGGTGMMRLHIVDTTDPASPEVLAEAPVPATTSLDIDGPRQLLVLFNGDTDSLFAYDVRQDTLEPLGEGIDLRVHYPEENSTAFSARNLTIDPWNARIYAARSQTALSELIVLDYPDAVPGSDQGYGDVATFEIEPVQDPFDLDVDIADRPGILDAFTPLPSPTDALVFLTASAWNGTLPSATLVTMQGQAQLSLEPGCEDHEGFGCFLRSWSDSMPIAFEITDGAACRDTAHNVVVTTALGSPDDSPGQVVFFRYDDDGSTAPWLADGGNLGTAAFPVATACH